ncbi:MAG: ParB/RepB/Spo0J family partition protein [Gemmatimonadota bacterium]
MPKEETRLGKGLGALLGEYLEEVEGVSAPEREVSLTLIRANPFQPRAGFEDGALDELARSIEENGLLQPLVVRPSGSGWEIVAGERRWRALEKLGWEKVPVVVRELTDEAMLVLALVENLQREDLSALEEAVGYRQLIDGFGLTQREVARRVGKKRSTVANTLRLLALPEEIRQMLAAGRLTSGHARAILGVDGEEAQVALAREVARRNLSVRATEERVRELREGGRAKGRRRETRSSAPDPLVARAEKLLERTLGTHVRLRVRNGSRGEIRIAFHDPEDFSRLLRLLLGEAAEELIGPSRGGE